MVTTLTPVTPADLGGYYTKMMSEVDYGLKVRAIVLNTNLFSQLDAETEGMADPAGQFAWLENLLDIVRTNKEKVPRCSTADAYINIASAISLSVLVYTCCTP